MGKDGMLPPHITKMLSIPAIHMTSATCSLDLPSLALTEQRVSSPQCAGKDVKALIDTGCQYNLISSACVYRLG